MSVCSNTIRALSRSRISNSKTLLPFLYHTATIQQWRCTEPPIARRNFASRSPVKNDIPFEDESLPPAIDRAEPARKSTLTRPERAAFQKLYRKFKAQEHSTQDQDHVVELDQIADEYYEDDEEPATPAPSVDKVFDEVLKKAPRLRGSHPVTHRPTDKPSASKQDALSQFDKVPGPKISKAKADAFRIKAVKLAERSRIDALLEAAPTDHELWHILEREVLDPVRRLNLDGPTKERKAKPSDKARILFQNYPSHLITAVVTLRTAFPSSSLPLAILPTIKALGRSAYALGVTTTLYKHLIHCAWLQYASYTRVDQLLMDMYNGAIEFDSGILDVLNSIIKEHEMARSGELGNNMQLVYGMEQFLDGIKQIRRWRGLVTEKLGIRLVEEKRMQRRQEATVARRENAGFSAAAQGARHETVEETHVSDMEPSQSNKTNMEDLPLVEGVDELETGLQKPVKELVDEREAELLMEDLDLSGTDTEEIDYRSTSYREESRTEDQFPESNKIML